MRLVVHDYAGHPFQVQLSRELARRGHDVLHLHCSSYVTGKGSLERQPDDPETFQVEPIDLGEPFERYSYAKRVRQERRYARLCAARVEAYRPDLFVSSNTPLFAQRILLPRVRRGGTRFVFWQQDIYSVAMADEARNKVPLVGGAIGRAFVEIERRLVRASDGVVVISADFVPVLREWGIGDTPVEVIENWAPLDELPPAERDNPWAHEHGLVGKRVFLYSGTLGLKHNPQLLLELARHLRSHDDAVLVVVSEGLGADWLRANADETLRGVLVQLPFQPFDRLPEVFATSDVLVSILEPEASVFSVPSKVLSYHCAGRPILAAIPSENLAARIITGAGSGLVVDPGDAAAFVAAAEDLAGDEVQRVEMGTRARAYAVETFDVRVIADRFEGLFGRVGIPHPTPNALEEQ